MLNEIEAGQILGQDVKEGFDKEKLGRALMECFPKAVIVLTLGKEGAMYMDQNESFLQPSYKVEAVDTTAAGDTFTGYFIGGILRGLSVGKAMDMASRASAIAVTRQGASPSIPVLREVENFQFS